VIDYLYQTSDLNLFLILSSFFIAISVAALLLIKKFWPLHLRYQENAVIGCTSALVIVIYGVLAGFATLHLINNYNTAIDAIQREANAAANLDRESRELNESLRTKIHEDVKKYITEVINVEWPLMNSGKTISTDGDFIIQNILDELKNYTIGGGIEPLIIADMITISRNLYDARQNRIQLSYISLSNEVWVVILVGTILTLFVSYLFGVNFYLHIFIAVAAALMTASIIFLLISLDKPFQGDFIIGPETFNSVLAFINKN
jgi:hypothetical protein